MSFPIGWLQPDAVLLTKIIATLVAVVIYAVVRVVRNRAIDRIAGARNLHPPRVAEMRRVVGIISVIVLVGVLALTWSVQFSSLVIASGAIVAAIGVAFFAQWSILSNVTTSIIMFWRFPIHVGDRVGLVSDRNFSGVVRELTPFFIVLTDENGNTVTIPNALSLQQMFIVYDHATPERIKELEQQEQDEERPGDVSANG